MKQIKTLIEKKTKTKTKIKKKKTFEKLVKNGIIVTLLLISGVFGAKYYVENRFNEIEPEKILIVKKTLKNVNPFRSTINPEEGEVEKRIEDLKSIHEDFGHYGYSNEDYIKDKKDYFSYKDILLKQYRDLLSSENLVDNEDDETIKNDLKFETHSLVRFLIYSSVNISDNDNLNMKKLSYDDFLWFKMYYEDKYKIKFKDNIIQNKIYSNEMENKKLGEMYYKLFILTLNKNINEANIMLKKEPELTSYLIRTYGSDFELIKKLSVSDYKKIEDDVKKVNSMGFEVNDNELRFFLKKVSYIKYKSKIISNQIDKEKFKDFNYDLWLKLSPIVNLFSTGDHKKDSEELKEDSIKVILNDFKFSL